MVVVVSERTPSPQNVMRRPSEDFMVMWRFCGIPELWNSELARKTCRVDAHMAVIFPPTASCCKYTCGLIPQSLPAHPPDSRIHLFTLFNTEAPTVSVACATIFSKVFSQRRHCLGPENLTPSDRLQGPGGLTHCQGLGLWGPGPPRLWGALQLAVSISWGSFLWVSVPLRDLRLEVYD